jgi:hypothetical protein
MPRSVLKRLRTKLKRTSGKRPAADEGQLTNENELLKSSKEVPEVGDGDSKTESESERQVDIPATKKHIYPQVCPECHHAWVERRFGDIERHRNARIGESKDEDCLLWTVISQGPEDTEVEDVSAAVGEIKLMTETFASDGISLTGGELGAKSTESINLKRGSENGVEKSVGSTLEDSEGAALELRDDAEEIVSE